jgi:hypothetical protein
MADLNWVKHARKCSLAKIFERLFISHQSEFRPMPILLGKLVPVQPGDGLFESPAGKGKSK